MTNISVKGLKLDSLTAEQKALLEAKLSERLGTAITLTATTSKPKLGQLEGKLDEAGNYVCSHCNSVANLNELSEENKTYAVKYGICPNCAAKVRTAEQIKKLSPRATYQRVGDSAKTIAESYIMKYAALIDTSMMNNMMDKTWSLKNMGLHYPLFKEVPANISPVELKELLIDNKGKRRFGNKLYTFEQLPGRTFVMTNDFYKDRVAKIEATLSKAYPSTNEEIVEG